MYDPIMMRTISSFLLPNTSCLIASAIVLHSWARDLALSTTTSVRYTCGLLVIRSFVPSIEANWLRVATMRSCRCRNHLTRLAIHVRLRCCSLNSWGLYMMLLSLLIVLLLVITSTVMTLCWSRCIHLNHLLDCLIIIRRLSCTTHIHPPQMSLSGALGSQLHLLCRSGAWSKASWHESIITLILRFLLSFLT